MINICTQHISDWFGPFSTEEQTEALLSLEQGQVIFLPQLAFKLQDEEKRFLTPACATTKSKNVSYDRHRHKLQGSSFQPQETEPLKQLMERFAEQATSLVKSLFPPYQTGLKIARTSYRPVEISGRSSSYRKDDTRLHVDAFPSTPTRGDRILRVFTNINPDGRPRRWRLGEPFEDVVKRFVPGIQKPILGSHTLLKWLGITKSRRTLYDHYMLHIHNAMKADEVYQTSVHQIDFNFPPGCTWIVMTDATSHAAMEGQYVLEQTFYLPIKHMRNPDLSPHAILEKFLGLRA